MFGLIFPTENPLREKKKHSSQVISMYPITFSTACSNTDISSIGLLFFTMQDLLNYLSHTSIVVCSCFQFAKVYIFVPS